MERDRRRMGTHWGRLSVWALAGAVFLSTVAAAGASVAAPGASHGDLRQAKAELRALNVRLSLLAQRYHETLVSLRRYQREAGSARRQVARARAIRAGAQADLDLRAKKAYEGSTVNGMVAVLGFHSISDVSAGLEFLTTIAQDDAAAARWADVARVTAQRATGRLRSLIVAQRAALTRLTDERAALQAAVGSQKALIDQIEQRIHRQFVMAQAAAAVAAAARASQAPPTTTPPSTPSSPSSPPPTTSVPTSPTPPPSPSQSSSPSPDPTGGGQPSGGGAPPPENQIDALIYSIWGNGDVGATAECIADHESGDDPSARNRSSGAAGLFQLMPALWDGNNAYGWKFDPYGARENATHAYLLWRQSGWAPWGGGGGC